MDHVVTNVCNLATECVAFAAPLVKCEFRQKNGNASPGADLGFTDYGSRALLGTRAAVYGSCRIPEPNSTSFPNSCSFSIARTSKTRTDQALIPWIRWLHILESHVFVYFYFYD